MVEGRPVGVGFDLADAGRLGSSLSRRPGLAERLFTPAERERLAPAASAADPLPAARNFAAKEAVMKSLGVGIDSVAFTEIELDEQATTISLSGRAERRAADLGVRGWSVELGVRQGPRGPVATAEVLALG